MMWGQTAQLWEADPGCGFLTWGETHSPHAHGVEWASRLSQTGPGLHPPLVLGAPSSGWGFRR